MNLRAASVLLLFACEKTVAPAPAPASQPVTQTPIFTELGGHSRKITTASPLAQQFFDQGLAFLFAFNHAEAIRAFEEAARQDPGAAMAHWGIALAQGPHINFPMVPPEHAKAAWAALADAKKRGGSEVERALVEALSTRYADPQPEDRSALDKAYADAMRALHVKYPDDGDIGALFAEALMDLRPWDLYKKDGALQPGTDEILATLEKVIGKYPRHLLALHLYIHAVEAGPTPEKADAAAHTLRDLAPGLGHLVHMPSHIDVRRGRWAEAALVNTRAMAADKAYREKVPAQGFYRIYMAHNFHMRAFAAMMIGKKSEAIESIDEMLRAIPEAWAKENAGVVDGFFAMPLEVRMRFGMWEEILAAPALPEHFPVARALAHYARGVAYAATKRPKDARAEQKSFKAAVALVAKDAAFGNNAAHDLLGVADRVLEGEILVREGNVSGAIAALKQGVTREDALRYDEPPDWIQPVRHALAAVLLDAKKHKEAEPVLREDLKKLPRNGWSLYGLSRALVEQKKDEEANSIRRSFDEVWGQADFQIASPCACVGGPGK